MKKISKDILRDFQKMLYQDEKSQGTIEKYMHDVQLFCTFAKEAEVDIELVLQFKKKLLEDYAVSTANSILVALNRLFRYLQWKDCEVKTYRIQAKTFRSKERELTMEEYERLVRTAENHGNIRLALLMQTLASTGIRISELPFITMEAIKTGRATVIMKGKSRIVLLPEKLCEKLMHYAEERGITQNSIFVTRNGTPLDRSNVLHEMKKLGCDAGIDEKKIFPHNFRHLFACQFYKTTKDMTHLADILGHTNLNTTRIYTAVSDEEQLQWIEDLRMVL